MTKLTAHQALPMNAVNKQLEIEVAGPAELGHYVVRWLGQRRTITFHTGDPRAGVNGVTPEAVLAILTDRLEAGREHGHGSQAVENAIAHLKEAMFHLHAHTTDRVLRGVEGASTL